MTLYVIGSFFPALAARDRVNLAKGSLITFRAIAKGNQIPCRANCMQNLRIACNADNGSNIPLGEFNLKLKNVGTF